jgi:hypothetical protein
MSNYQKYLKYKNKYNQLKIQLGGNYDEQIVDLSEKDMTYGNLINYFITNYVKDEIDDINVRVFNDIGQGVYFKLNEKELDVSKLCDSPFCRKIFHLGQFRYISSFNIKLKYLKKPFPKIYEELLLELQQSDAANKQIRIKEDKLLRIKEESMDKEFLKIQSGELNEISEELYYYLLEKSKIIAEEWRKEIKKEEVQYGEGYIGYSNITTFVKIKK